MIAIPCGDEAADQGVDLGLGADVDAAGGLVEEQELGLGQEPAGEDALLLVAPREAGDRRAAAGGLDREPLDRLGHRAGLGAAVDQAAAGQGVEAADRDVLGDGHLGRTGRASCGPRSPGRPRRRSPRRGRGTGRAWPSSVIVPAGGSGWRRRGPRAARSGPRRAGRRRRAPRRRGPRSEMSASDGRPLSRRARQREVRRPRAGSPCRRSGACSKCIAAISRPTIQRTTCSGLVSARVAVGDEPAVAEDGHAVGQGEDLVHLVRDVEDGRARACGGRR